MIAIICLSQSTIEMEEEIKHKMNAKWDARDYWIYPSDHD